MNLAIIQARMGSTRLPNKVLKKVNNTPLLAYQIKRLKLSEKIDKIVIATGDNRQNDPIEKMCNQIKTPCFRGSEDDVLERYYKCSIKYPKYDHILRITGDCPLIDPYVVDQVIDYYKKNKFEYVSNVEPPTYPDGMDIEIFTKSILEKVHKAASLDSEREHVTWLIRKSNKFAKENKFIRGNHQAPHDFSHFRLTVDEERDFEVIKYLIKNSKLTDSYTHYISLLTKNPKIMLKNMSIIRNEGLAKSLKKDYENK
jgi:spore coat polysaccharide biosynthesis protein SpsF (cytidylyltransferase family)